MDFENEAKKTNNKQELVGTLQRAVNLLTHEIVCIHTCMYTHVVQGLADQHQSKNLQKKKSCEQKHLLQIAS